MISQRNNPTQIKWMINHDMRTQNGPLLTIPARWKCDTQSMRGQQGVMQKIEIQIKTILERKPWNVN